MSDFYPQRGVRLLLEGWAQSGLAALSRETLDPALVTQWAAEGTAAASAAVSAVPPPRPAFQPRSGFGTAPSPSPAPAQPGPPPAAAVPARSGPAAAASVSPVVPQKPAGLNAGGNASSVSLPPASPSAVPATPSPSLPVRPAASRGALFELESAPLPKPAAKPASASAAPVTAGESSLPGQPPRLALALDPVARPLAERQSLLTVLNDRVKACRRCELLASQRTQTVFGVGNPEARVAFVGEAPGADEDASGIPFVGRAGQLLDKIITACGFRRDDVYICNVLRCRPPGNRTPDPQECANCREFLEDQLAVVNPEFIVCWGAVAATNVTGKQLAIGKLRRQFFTFRGAKVLCTYHPSYLLRNPAAKKDVWEDMKLLLAEMGLPVPA